MSDTSERFENENIELDLLIEAIHRKYGYDFRNYSKAHLKRRMLQRLKTLKLDNFLQLTSLVLNDVSYVHEILKDLSVNVTEMFRDPWFYRTFRQTVIPKLRTYPYIKIWLAGCSSGEEVYSLAILLEEENIYDKCTIYATDFNPAILQKAKDGIYPVKKIKEYTSNYIEAGGKADFSDYYVANYDSTILNKSLKRNVVFSDHNLAQDGVFGEMNLIFCRNVMIYFDRDLQNKVIKLFSDSLVNGGYLCLGSKESLRFSPYYQNFKTIAEKEKIYRKNYR